MSVVTGEGFLKFVDVDNGRYRSTKSTQHCTITCWILKTPESGWEKETTLQSGDLWSLPDYQDSTLPRKAPTYPVVNQQDTSILYLIVEGVGEAWMMTVDIEKKSFPAKKKKKKSLSWYEIDKNRISYILCGTRKIIYSDLCKYLTNP